MNGFQQERIMMFDKLLAKDKRLSKIASGIEKRIPNEVQNDAIAESCAVLAHLVGALSDLKDGYLILAESKNLYSANVQLRVFLEHVLKAMAVFLEASRQDKTLAEGYFRLAEVEARAYLKALEYAGIDEEEMDGTPTSVLFAKGKALTNRAKTEIEDPFRHKNLIQSIRQVLGDEAAEPFLLKIVPNYAELSGFVHGGPSTSLILLAAENCKSEKLYQDAELVVSMFFSVKRYLLMLVSELNQEFNAAYNELNEAILQG